MNTKEKNYWKHLDGSLGNNLESCGDLGSFFSGCKSVLDNMCKIFECRGDSLKNKGTKGVGVRGMSEILSGESDKCTIGVNFLKNPEVNADNFDDFCRCLEAISKLSRGNRIFAWIFGSALSRGTQKRCAYFVNMAKKRLGELYEESGDGSGASANVGGDPQVPTVSTTGSNVSNIPQSPPISTVPQVPTVSTTGNIPKPPPMPQVPTVPTKGNIPKPPPVPTTDNIPKPPPMSTTDNIPKPPPMPQVPTVPTKGNIPQPPQGLKPPPVPQGLSPVQVNNKTVNKTKKEGKEFNEKLLLGYEQGAKKLGGLDFLFNELKRYYDNKAKCQVKCSRGSSPVWAELRIVVNGEEIVNIGNELKGKKLRCYYRGPVYLDINKDNKVMGKEYYLADNTLDTNKDFCIGKHKFGEIAGSEDLNLGTKGVGVDAGGDFGSQLRDQFLAIRKKNIQNKDGGS